MLRAAVKPSSAVRDSAGQRAASARRHARSIDCNRAAPTRHGIPGLQQREAGWPIRRNSTCRRHRLSICRVAESASAGEPLDNSRRQALSPVSSGIQWMQQAAPCRDALDKQIWVLFLPAMVNLLLVPLVGAVDVFWVGHMNHAIALAAMGTANQIYDAVAILSNFLPLLITPVVAKAAASGNRQFLTQKVGETMMLTLAISIMSVTCIVTFPEQLLSIVGMTPGSEVLQHSIPYILCRAVSLPAIMLATVGFATYRGMMDTVTPLKIAAVSQLINIVLDPVFIFGVPALGIPAMGVAGGGIATAISEYVLFSVYMWLLFRDKILNLQAFRFPRFPDLWSLLVGGVSVQIRSLALQVCFLVVAKKTLEMDMSGTVAAAHTLTQQMFRIGLYGLLALSGVATTLVPQAVNRPGGGINEGRMVADRLLMWGLIGGALLGILQVLSLPMLHVFSSIPAVQAAAVVPCLMGAFVQVTTGMMFVGEGVMQGLQAFQRLGVNTIIAATVFMCYISVFGQTLTSVWFGFWIFTNIRLVAAMHYHFVSGPFGSDQKPSKPVTI